MGWYDRPRVLVIYCPCSKHEAVIYRPCEIWPTFKKVMALFGVPYKWGWRGEMAIGETLSTE